MTRRKLRFGVVGRPAEGVRRIMVRAHEVQRRPSALAEGDKVRDPGIVGSHRAADAQQRVHSFECVRRRSIQSEYSLCVAGQNASRLGSFHTSNNH